MQILGPLPRTLRRAGSLAALATALCVTATLPARAADGVTRGAPIVVHRAAGEITVDGRLEDPGWQGAVRIDTWYETNPADNVPAKVGNVAWLTYDDRFFYAAFEFSDPHPEQIRAPLGDHDAINGNSDDYGGVILDTRNDGKTAVLLLANPRGLQYDAVSADASGEDSSPDFFWDSAARITEDGWVLEMRVPFSSLRYEGSSPQWGILLYRNMPREFRTQMFAERLPRDENCFICHVQPLEGLAGLPEGGSLTVAPYATASQASTPRDGPGSPLETGSAEGDGGVDLKWLPNPGLALDATVNPDFSQIESDVAQIAANERFALFFPEKRPFFLEGVDLLATPIQAVYTRTVTDPAWGARATGRVGSTGYTLLVADDRGGGSVILPGPNSSGLARQDFASTVTVGRLRHDLGRSFASFLVTDREIDGGAYNRVFGPDFEWRPGQADRVSGQLLWSESRTPERPDLAATWDGRRLSGHGARLSWSHGTDTVDWFAGYWDFADGFRADSGYVPQVGYREGYGELGYTFHPDGGPVRRWRPYLSSDYTETQDGELLGRLIRPGISLDALWSSFASVELGFDTLRAVDRVFDVRRLIFDLRSSPTRRITRLELEGQVGDQVDYANDRLGSGAGLTFEATVQPTDHLQLSAHTERRWLDLDEPGAHGRLFTADVARLRGQYTFTARSYLRLIGQWVETERDPTLYTSRVTRRDAGLAGSALFAYKLNWQTVLFVGYGDERALVLDPQGDRLEPAARQVFVKLSYAFQH